MDKENNKTPTKKTKLREQNEKRAARAKAKKELKANYAQQIENHAPGDTLESKHARKLYAYKLLADYKEKNPHHWQRDGDTLTVLNALADLYYYRHKAAAPTPEKPPAPPKAPGVLPSGITYNRKTKKYIAKITVKNALIILGKYPTLGEARKARNEALKIRNAARGNPTRLERAFKKITLKAELEELI